jgi:hypothetical protein
LSFGKENITRGRENNGKEKNEGVRKRKKG